MPKESSSAVDNTFRRKWDRDEYEAKAKERDDATLDDSRRNRGREVPGMPRAPLKQREHEVDLVSKLGKTQVVTPVAPLNQQAGYYCDVCECVVKDSANYLDHINGKKHQRALGMSMRVERSTLHQVQQRFELLKRKQEAGSFTEAEFDLRVAKQQEEEELRKRQRKERKKEKKKEVGASDGESFLEDDPEMAALMGFGGFGSSKK